MNATFIIAIRFCNALFLKLKMLIKLSSPAKTVIISKGVLIADAVSTPFLNSLIPVPNNT